MKENEQRLHQAIEDNDKQLIENLIQDGVNLKARNDRGMNCLHLAVERSSVEIVTRLLEADKSLVDEVVVCSERESDIVGYTALHFSAKLPDWLIAYSLLRNGAKGDVVDQNLRTPLHVAVLYGSTRSVEELLRYSSVTAEDCEKKTAFMYAVERDHVDVVKLMLTWADKETFKSYAKAIIDTASDSRCLEFVQSQLYDNRFYYYEKIIRFQHLLIATLQCAIEKKRVYLINNLLSSENISLDNRRMIATVDSVNESNIKVAELLMNYNYIIKFVDIEAALHLALINNCNDILNTYLKKVNVDCKNVEGNSLLYMACFKNNVEAAEKCIALGCDVNAKNSSGETALHAACKSGNVDLIGLLKNSGCDVNVKNSSGDTALHAAVEHVNPELVNLLKDSGCKLNTKNYKLKTPLKLLLENHYSFHGRNHNLSSDVIKSKQRNVVDVAEMLLRSEMDSTCYEYGSECVLHLAVRTGIVELVKTVIKYHPSLEHLNKDRRQTCLHVAAELNFVDVVKFLLESGANPNVLDKNDDLPITIAIWERHEEMMKLLLNYSNLNAYKGSRLNKTVMHLAARRNNKEIISALLYAGADLHAKDSYGKTALCWAYKVREFTYQHLLNVGFDVNVGYDEDFKNCYFCFKFYRTEFAKIHLLKLKLIKYDLQPLLSSMVNNAEMEFKDVYSEISEEAKRFMTSFIPDTNIPFTDIIKLDDKKLANYAQNESVVKVFKDVDSLKVKWPHYSQILIARMTKGFVRRRLLDKCYVIFKSVVPKLLDECISLIFDKLETNQLHTFIISFPKVDTSEYDPPFFNI